jgi:hypothetical protein
MKILDFIPHHRPLGQYDGSNPSSSPVARWSSTEAVPGIGAKFRGKRNGIVWEVRGYYVESGWLGLWVHNDRDGFAVIYGAELPLLDRVEG